MSPERAAEQIRAAEHVAKRKADQPRRLLMRGIVKRRLERERLFAEWLEQNPAFRMDIGLTLKRASAKPEPPTKP